MNDLLLGIKVNKDSESDILEKIKKFLETPKEFFHIVSINPENVVISQKSREFQDVINKAQIKINDGVGIVVASRLLGIKNVPRLAGGRPDGKVAKYGVRKAHESSISWRKRKFSRDNV